MRWIPWDLLRQRIYAMACVGVVYTFEQSGSSGKITLFSDPAHLARSTEPTQGFERASAVKLYTLAILSAFLEIISEVTSGAI